MGTYLDNPKHSLVHLKENEEIAAIATELGTTPKGGSASVAARLTTIEASVAAKGDVIGPASAVSGVVTVFSGTTGKLIAQSALTGVLKATAGVLAVATTADFIAPSLGSAKGQMVVFTSSGVAAALAAPGTTGYVLTGDTTTGEGLAWKPAAGGANVTRGTFGAASLSTAGVLTITHNLGLSHPYSVVVTLWNNSAEQFYPDSVVGATNSCAVGLATFAITSGTLGYSLVAG